MLRATDRTPDRRRVAAGVERDEERGADHHRGEHRERWYQGVIPLAVDKVPAPTRNHLGDPWRKEQITRSRVCRHARDPHTILATLHCRQLARGVCRENRDVPLRGEPLDDLMGMRFHAPDVRGKRGCDLEEPRSTTAQRVQPGCPCTAANRRS
jgi:hypothetical protein